MQVEHKTEKGTLLFVKVNEAQTRFDIKQGYLRGFDKYGVYESIKLSSDNWQIIGLTSDVTGEQARIMFTKVDSVYPDYNNKESWCATALQSFKSLMQFKKVYEVNPIDKPNYNYKIDEQHSPSYVEEESYQETQQTTGTWLTLFKPND